MFSLKKVALLLLLVLPSIGFSQINLGIKAGANYNFNSSFMDSLNFSLDNSTSFLGGGFIRVKIKKISLQAEGLFAGRKGSLSISGVEKNIDFYSFDLPLIVGYKLVDLKVVKLRLNVGVIPSYPISSVGDLEDANFKDSFYSAMGGVSLDIPLFIFDLRYQGAIGEYYEATNVNSNTKFKSSLLTLSIAWKII